MATLSRPDQTRLPGMLQPLSRPADAVAFAVAAIVIVVAFGVVLAHTHTLTHADLGVDKALNDLHTGAMATVTSGVYWFFSPVQAVLLTIVIVAVIGVISRNLRISATFAFVVAATWLSSAVVKALVHRSRPDDTALSHPFHPQPVDASFPSGHEVFVVALAVAFVFLARGHAIRRVVVAIGIAATVVVGLALLVNGVHYPTDVLASIVWAAGVGPLSLLLWNRFVLPRTYRTPTTVEPRS